MPGFGDGGVLIQVTGFINVVRFALHPARTRPLSRSRYMAGR